MTADEVRALLKESVAAAKTNKEWAANAGVSAAYLTDMLLGNREPSSKVLTALGLEKIVIYQKVGIE